MRRRIMARAAKATASSKDAGSGGSAATEPATVTVRSAIADLYEALNEASQRLARQQSDAIAEAQQGLEAVQRECDEALREPAAALRTATEIADIRAAEDAYRTAHREGARQAADREIVLRTELSATLERFEQEADDQIANAWIKFAADAGQALTLAAQGAGTPADVRELRRQLETLASVVPSPYLDATAR
jgi:flagellar biosynthesis/type III secretory pathway protein FliH